MESVKKYSKFIEIALAIFALSGIAFPLINFKMHLIGTINISFSFTDMFRDFSNDVLGDTLDLATSDNLFSGVSMSVILPLISYILAIILIVIILVLTFINKFKTVRIILLSTALPLMLYAGIGINDFPNSLKYELEKFLAYFLDGVPALLMPAIDLSSAIDFSSIFEINLGIGYWITLCALLMLLIVLIVGNVFDHTKKRTD